LDRLAQRLSLLDGLRDCYRKIETIEQQLKMLQLEEEAELLNSTEARLLTTGLDTLFSQATVNRLRQAGINNLTELANWSEVELMKRRSFGVIGLVEVRFQLARLGLRPKGGYTEELPASQSVWGSYLRLATQFGETATVRAADIGITQPEPAVDPAGDVPEQLIADSISQVIIGELPCVGNIFRSFLSKRGILTIGQLAQYSEYQLISIRWFGFRRLVETRLLLSRYNLQPRGGYTTSFGSISFYQLSSWYRQLANLYGDGSAISPESVGLPPEIR
jgi:DNA-directed RNA polymerase alpha subunit